MEYYRVSLVETDNGYLAKQVDFNIAIDADTIEHAVGAIKNHIETESVLRLRNGEPIPQSTDETMAVEEGVQNIYVELDIEKAYRESFSESVRKNISMPGWMDAKLRYYGVDASKLFQDAAMAYIEAQEEKKYKPITTIEELTKQVNSDLLKEYARIKISEMLGGIKEA